MACSIASGRRRVSDSSRPKAYSATVCSPYVGTLQTVIPRSFAISSETLLKPVERQAIIRRFGRASSMS